MRDRFGRAEETGHRAASDTGRDVTNILMQRPLRLGTRRHSNQSQSMALGLTPFHDRFQSTHDPTVPATPVREEAHRLHSVLRGAVWCYFVYL